MAMDRPRTGLTVLRVSLGVFFLFEGIGKLRWFGNSGILAAQLAGWAQTVPPQSMPGRYLAHVALPWVAYFARLVPIGVVKG